MICLGVVVKKAKKTKPYMNLAIEMSRYSALVDNWKKAGFTGRTFTVWSTQVLESALSRYKKLFELYPDYNITITNDGKFIIEHGEDLVRVFVKDGKLDCTATNDREIYLTVAALHPFFKI